MKVGEVQDDVLEASACEGEVQDDVLEASACYSGGKWDHECCIHDNKVRLECGLELPMINALCRKRM